MPRRHGGLLHNLCPCLGIYLLLSAVGADQARILVQLTRRSVDAPNNADDAAIAAAQELVVALTRYIQNTAVGGCVSLSLFINYAGRPVVIVWAVLVQPPRAQNCMRDIRLLAQSTDTQPRAIISTSPGHRTVNSWSTLPRMQRSMSLYTMLLCFEDSEPSDDGMP